MRETGPPFADQRQLRSRGKRARLPQLRSAGPPMRTIRSPATPAGLALAGVLVVVCARSPGCTRTAPITESFVNGVGMLMTPVPGGRLEAWDEEVAPFFLSDTPVTNAQYEVYKPGHREKRIHPEAGDEHPVVRVSWKDAAAYAAWATEREGIRYELPTEIEWEWAASAGELGYRYGTNDGELDHERANIAGISGRDQFERTSPVRSFPPNPFGLYDLTGNVWEWVDSWYYERRTLHRVWLTSRFRPGLRLPFVWFAHIKKWRVVRGGSYVHEEPLQRCTVRNAYKPHTSNDSYGFRLVARIDG